MARWSSDFLGLLDGEPTDTEGASTDSDGSYAPRFRLIIGTVAFTEKLTPHFELNENVIVAYSHGIADGGTSDISNGEIVEAPHAIGQFNITAQEVTPRNWTYASPQLSMEISPEFAALLARYASPGSLVSMSCNLRGERDIKTSFGSSKDHGLKFSDIFFGQFRNMTYTGGRYQIVCRGFVEAAIGNPTIDRRSQFVKAGLGLERNPSDWSFGGASVLADFDYFSNVGTTVPLRDSWDGTNAGLSSPGPLSGLIADETRTLMYFKSGFGQRRVREGRFDPMTNYTAYLDGPYLPFYGYGVAQVNPDNTGAPAGTTRKPYVVTYGDPASIYSAQDLAEDLVSDTWFRNADDRAFHNRLGAYTTTTSLSTISSRVYINGNPAVELATMLYSEKGWRCGWWVQARLFPLHSHYEHIELAYRETLANVVADELEAGRNYPSLCAEVRQPAANGKGFIDSVFGGIGVFPVFKAGGLSVATCSDISGERSGLTERAILGVEGFEKVIGLDDVADIIEIQYRAPQTENSFQVVDYSNEGKASTATVAVECAVTSDRVASGFEGESAKYATSQPFSQTYTFKAGAYNTVYPDIIANDFKRRCASYLLKPFGQISLRLRGLKWAYLAPGDIVYLDVERFGFDSTHYGSTAVTSLGLNPEQPSMVIKHRVDWLKGFVDITVLRHVAKPDEL